jgi:tetratricopeptide (TPR) repeat protein
MSYFDEPDSDAEKDDQPLSSTHKVFTEDELTNLQSSIEQLKQQGNTAFSQDDYKQAILLYTEAINSLKQHNQPPNSILHLNRSASYLSEKLFVKALHDANIACEIDENNWKGHWRKGLGEL